MGLPQRHRGLGVTAFDDGDFGGREVVELVDEVVDFAVGALDLGLDGVAAEVGGLQAGWCCDYFTTEAQSAQMVSPQKNYVSKSSSILSMICTKSDMRFSASK